MNNHDDKQFDDLIARALAIDVPELVVPELPDIAPASVTNIGKHRRFSPPAWFAMAATVAIAAIVGVRILGTSVEYDSLPEQILAHIDHEPAALRISDTPVSDKRLHDVVSGELVEFDHGAGLITYAQSCVINGHRVPHLVIQGEYGPITILLMPEETVSAAMDIMGEHVNGVILPVGNGSIAIVGEREEKLEVIRKKILDSVAWTT